ncbi:MAG: ATP-binding cassette domain-containing protein [Candidatus Cloacimonetes bacterium]|nr:ATP-binding cassette domain-containing protein [Candidatus Cloacimonadota bacterium]MDD4156651.1 ATP-binding cassette domain-containing protein [Candidatus Cloacimonadota bacterium]
MLKIDSYKLFSSDKLILSIPELSIEKGNFLYIQGNNFSGKTLFLNSLYGDYKNFKGSVLLNNKKISQRKDENSVFLIDSDLIVISDMTFLQHLEIPFKNLSIHQKNRVIEMASILGVMDILNVKAKYFSKSEKMMLYILRIALISPYLLLIDDLDFYFDNDNLKKVYQLILYCLKSGMIVIATGKTKIKNVPLYHINACLLENVCPSIDS